MANIFFEIKEFFFKTTVMLLGAKFSSCVKSTKSQYENCLTVDSVLFQ
uniref:Uncharacterized protein n=1 Tax=Lepeophtheirus salmonis TaxID=72036 RepID=A0A0K2TZK0_LEPSM